MTDVEFFTPIATFAPAAIVNPVDPRDEVRQLALDDLFSFAKLVNPQYVYGEVHKKVFRFLQDTSHPNQLVLLPRGHLKSHCIAVWCAWWITKHPETSIMYISATTTLAEAQLYAIKNILASDVYTRYWPEMIHPEEGKREKWSSGAIRVDHPRRRQEGTRDDTVFAAGLTTNTTGLHADVVVSDDVVVPENAYTKENRDKTAAAMSQMASILNTGGMIKACGTRYHPQDQYSIWIEQFMQVFDATGEIVEERPIWDIMEEVVEVDGVFLWPRTARPSDGKMFGFNFDELNRIYAMYTDKVQYYAQYYNNPNDPESARMDETRFQYYDPSKLSYSYGNWYYDNKKLNLTAAIDFAYTTSKKSDYTAIAVVGIDCDHNVFILGLDRFKTDKIQVYYERVELMYEKWGFRKLRAEATAAQSIIVGDLKDRIKQNGGTIRVDANKPNRNQGSKDERVRAVLEPRYDNMQMWHYKGGYIPMLEEELTLSRPPHDDLKDVVAAAVEVAKAPRAPREREIPRNMVQAHLFNNRFGGVAYR